MYGTSLLHKWLSRLYVPINIHPSDLMSACLISSFVKFYRNFCVCYGKNLIFQTSRKLLKESKNGC